MTTISRLNETISNHAGLANAIAFGLLATISVVSATAISYSGQRIQDSYDSLVLSIPTAQTPVVETPASKVQASPQASTIVAGTGTSPLAIQSQQPDVVVWLQPAPGLVVTAPATASTLQPSTNGVQLTGANLQNAAGIQ